MDDNEPEIDEMPIFDIILEDGPPKPLRMVIIKLLGGGDIHAEDDQGQMIIARVDGTVQTYLHDDNNWVHGELPGVTEQNIGPVAWDVIGYHFGITDGLQMGRVRDGKSH